MLHVLCCDITVHQDLRNQGPSSSSSAAAAAAQQGAGGKRSRTNNTQPQPGDAPDQAHLGHGNADESGDDMPDV
jgi:hypothetical protein